MIFIKRYRIELLLAVLLIAVLTNLAAMLRRGQSVPDQQPLIEAYDRIIQAKDQVIQVQEKLRAELREERIHLQARDSALIIQLAASQPKYVANEKKYNQIPAAVDGLDLSQLRREFSTY